MKKVSLLIAMIAFVCGNAFAQLSFDFNDGVAGAKIAETYGDPWTTWSYAPGSAEDGVFDEAGGSMAAHFTYGNDQVVMLGDHSTGVYDLEFDAFVPDGKSGYFNVLHHFTGNPNTCVWAMQVYMQEMNDGEQSTISPGHGTVHAGSNGTADLPCVYDPWMHYRVHVDADNDVAQLYFNVVGQEEELYAEWQWSKDSFGEEEADRVLGAMDFYPPTEGVSEYYIDNLTVTLQSNDEILLTEPFEEYTVGNHIAAESVDAGHDWWTTWSSAPGGNEDGVVADLEGNKCGHLTYGNDQVLLLGDEENGNYDLEFDILVPEGKNGYFNILHRFAGSSNNTKWAMQCYLHLINDGENSTSAPGQGTIHAGSNSTAVVENLVYDAWMHFRLNVDTDTDVARYYYTAPGEEEVLVCQWTWSLDSFGNATVGRTLAAMNFYPPEDEETSEYYLDNFSFKKIGGESAPEVSIDPEEVTMELEEDDLTSVEITIDNTGNSIADWDGYIDFGQGEGGTDQQEILHGSGMAENLSGLVTANYIEIANKFPVSYYGGSVMGTKLKSVKYFVATDSDDVLGFTGDLCLRAYKVGHQGVPGELLGEVIIPESEIVVNDWNTGTFTEDIWLTGYDVFVSAGFQQVDGGYPVVFDNTSMVPGVRYLLVGGSGSWSLVDDIWDSNYNFCLSAVCEGTPIPGSWATIDKTEGSIFGGQSEIVTLRLNSIGLNLGEDYTATFLINTNDEENPQFNIPITLAVRDGIEETVNQLASIYPNPATSVVTLKGENLNSVAIYNVAGQLVRVVKLDNMVNTIDMNVESGVYFFSVYDNNGRNSVQRVVITK